MKIFLAGAEKKRVSDILKLVGHPYILASYYYRQSDLAERAVRYTEEVLGAEVFLGGVRRDKVTSPEGEAELEEYIEEYARWLVEYGDAFKYYCEVDVGTKEDKTRWRKQLEEKGLHPVPVHHVWDGWDYLQDLMNQYEMIAIGGKSNIDAAEALRYLRTVVIRAADTGVKLHIFGITTVEVLERLRGMYSCDSTSWLGGSMYGMTYQMRGRKMEQFQKDEKRRRRLLIRQPPFKSIEEGGLGLDSEKFLADDPVTVDTWNAWVWAVWGQGLDKRSEVDSQAKYYAQGLAKGGVSPPVKKGDKLSMETREKMRQSALRRWRREPLLMRCDNCYISDRCPEANKDEKGKCQLYEFWFGDLPADVDEITIQGILGTLKEKYRQNLIRFKRSLAFEDADGGLVDKRVTELSKHLSYEADIILRLANQLAGRADMPQQGQVINIAILVQQAGSPGEIALIAERRRSLLEVERKLLQAHGVDLGGQAKGVAAEGEIVAHTRQARPVIEGEFEVVDDEEE